MGGFAGLFSRRDAAPVRRDRLDAMLVALGARGRAAAGWVEEARRLRALPQPLSREASQALGYREIGEVLDGRRSLAEAVAEVQLRTRQFAKRQLTWFRALPGVEFVDAKLTFRRWADRMSGGPLA